MTVVTLTLSTPVLLSEASGPPAYLGPLAALVLAAAVIGYITARLKIVPIVGFLLAGVVIGPFALGVLGANDAVDAAADIGIILLLFTIGLQFSLGRLARVWVWIVVGGGLQVLLTSAAGVGLTGLAGGGIRDGVFTGFLLALSSTAIVLTILGARGEQSTSRGRLALALLIAQDLAVVAMVLVVPLLGEGPGTMGSPEEQTQAGATALLTAVGTAALVVLVVIVVARRVMPLVLDRVARLCSPPVFLLSIVAICFGTAYLTSLAGVSVSLGAFLAGLVVSESRSSTQALAEILPLQIIFSAVFFVSVGMMLDLGFVVENLPLVLGASVVVLLVKTALTTVAAIVVRVPWRTALATGLLLAQVGEFSFILLNVGTGAGLSPLGLGDDGTQVVVAATVLLMVFSPLLAGAGAWVERWRGGTPPEVAEAAERGIAQDEAPMTEHVVIIGMGPAALDIAATLRARDVAVLVTTLNPDSAAAAEARGHTVLRGDSVKEQVLREAGVPAARGVVIAEDDAETGAQLVSAVRAVTRAPIFIRPLGDTDVAELAEAGADHVVDRDTASARALTRSVLENLDLPLSDVLASSTLVDTSGVVRFPWEDVDGCVHGPASHPVLPRAPGCVGCLREGTTWVHLRVCLSCGYVGCCDSSPRRHARLHASGVQISQTGVEIDGVERHPLVVAADPDDHDWGYCFLDGVTVAAPPREAGTVAPAHETALQG